MSRRDIHYWKCDRPAAFHGTGERGAVDPDLEDRLRGVLSEHFGKSGISLRPAASQGTHRTWVADLGGREAFLRVETGPEADAHLAVESAVLDRVRDLGVPAPAVFGCDATRTRVPFAWQALERVPHPDLNHWFKAGALDAVRIAPLIGAAVARWQAIRPEGFGPFDPDRSPAGAGLAGYHPRYEGYFRLRLEEHLGFLRSRGFLDGTAAAAIRSQIDRHAGLLDLSGACLVHKDLALWNVLGPADGIAAFIDFDDAIGGDPMDDLSLLACFHDAGFVAGAVGGYADVRPLPEEHRRRFWLHLLRNLIVKAVIRVGAGYFDRSDAFFLIGPGASGADLRRFTHERLFRALRGLRDDDPIESL